jgi:hypothetical protein
MLRCLAVVGLLTLWWGNEQALAQNLTPYDPDIVFECIADGKPDNRCRYTCGTELSSPPGGKDVTYPNVSRVEVFNKGSIGHGDTRSWVFIKYQTAPTTKPSVIGLYLGPRYFCSGALLTAVGEHGQVNLELRLTKFKFN